MNKENWIKLFRAIGLDDQTMTQWHKEFEKNYLQPTSAEKEEILTQLMGKSFC